MPIHDFTHELAGYPKSSNDQSLEQSPQISVFPESGNQLSDSAGRSTILQGSLGVDPDYVQEYTSPGFRALDDAMKAYWSGIRVPTKDSYRFMMVKIAGGDKTLLVWNDELENGRVKLPVASLNRGSHEFNKEKFSPPYLHMARRYLGNRQDRVALVRRPVPFLVDYTMTVWAAHKRDAEYILQQILPRFNPLAEFTMFDGHLHGAVQLRYGGCADISEKEAGFDTRAKVRYEYKMTAESWLALPETVVPTILGRTTTVRESSGSLLSALLQNAIELTEGM